MHQLNTREQPQKVYIPKPNEKADNFFYFGKRHQKFGQKIANAKKVKSNLNPICCANTGAANQQQTSPTTGGKNISFLAFDHLAFVLKKENKLQKLEDALVEQMLIWLIGLTGLISYCPEFETITDRPTDRPELVLEMLAHLKN